MQSSGFAHTGRVRIKERDVAVEDWEPRATCKEIARHMTVAEQQAFVELFFPTRHSGPEEILKAKQVCEVCPVRIQCLANSLVNWERSGIWGGQSEKERRNTRKTLISHTRSIGQLPLTMETAIRFLGTSPAGEIRLVEVVRKQTRVAVKVKGQGNQRSVA